MNLKEYLEKQHITKRGFAKDLGITESHFHKILNRTSLPSGKTAQKIVELTDGNVSFEDLFKKKGW
ncbi:MAG: helix-turn-helix transcriptional regulator [Chlamydiota bacterium]